ncbi:MAG TPA: hypothetical protein VGH54_09830 [Mycobacterium sp.]|jgi:hypothetical protein|uniref:hypothetical protein n=1 Tax=Mycobacterium sp. TaxID=1785 RepID=UPI002F409A85
MSDKVEIPDAVVEAASMAAWNASPAGDLILWPPTMEGNARQVRAEIRAALEAALPLLPASGGPAVAERRPLSEALDEWPEVEGTFDEVLESAAAARLSGPAVDRYRLAWLSTRRRAAYASKAFFAEAAAANELEAQPVVDRQVIERVLRDRIDGSDAVINSLTAALVAALTEPHPVNSDLHHCTGCGAAVIGRETCGDPSRPECAALTEQPKEDEK